MTVASILKVKGNGVYTVDGGQMVEEIARLLAEHKIGAVVVVDQKEAVTGIFSERDLVSAVAAHGAQALKRPVGDYMTRNIFTCTPADTERQLMGLMTERRIRHIPVMDKGRLAGLVSIGDVVKYRIAETEMEANAMRQYIAAS